MKKNHNNTSPQALDDYLLRLTQSGEYAKYEVVLIALLNNQLCSQLDVELSQNLMLCSPNDFLISPNAEPSLKYTSTVSNLCKNKYFTQKYSPYEVEVNRNILLSLPWEVTMQELIKRNPNSTFGDFSMKLDEGPILRFHNSSHTGITHKRERKGRTYRHYLSFREGTPLKDIQEYLVEILEIKNNPRKPSKSLGMAYHMLRIANDIEKNPDEYKDELELRGYKDIVIANEMGHKYDKEVTQDQVAKALQRIKKIEKDVNTP